MLDVYTKGEVSRVSPEAPVPILDTQEQFSLPGGAGNVARNLVALGLQVTLIGRIGDDQEGRKLKSLLDKEALDTKGVYTQKGYITTVKHRFIANHQQLMRVDREIVMDACDEIEQLVDRQLVMEGRFDVVIVSDYHKGFLTKGLLRMVIERANLAAIPVLVDPKGDDFGRYFGATLIKPNWKEACYAAKLSSAVSIEEVASVLLHKTGVEHLVVTRAQAGIALLNKGERTIKVFPAKAKKVRDVTGAGDTVLAILAWSLGNKLDIQSSCHLANAAAGIVIQQVGCSAVAYADLAMHLLEVERIEKHFSDKHFPFLKLALAEKPLVALISDNHTSNLFHALTTARRRHPKRVILLYLKTDAELEKLEAILDVFPEVQTVTCKEDSFHRLCHELSVSEVYQIEEQQLVPTFSISRNFDT